MMNNRIKHITLLASILLLTSFSAVAQHINGTVFGGGNEASVTGGVSIGITSGTVTRGVFGGCNIEGTIDGDVVISLKGCTVGVENDPANIHGGGYGASTAVTGDVTIGFGEVEYDDSGEQPVEIHTTYPVLFGDMYGGSAFGSVNTSATNVTSISILNGTVNGNVYGGGLGDEDDGTKGWVNGTVYINVGDSDGMTTPTYVGMASFNHCSIFGGNNLNGSPQSDVFVDVYKTAHTATDLYDYTGNDRTYAIYQVFGGGNHADFAPENGNEFSTKKIHVSIHGCENTVEEVFGGSNAADAVGVYTVVDGGRFNFIFGGGNGILSAANVGEGGTYSQIQGGHVGYCFGGSNRLGNCINVVQDLETEGVCGDLVIDNLFNGGNMADQYGDQVLNLTCAENKTYLTAYGGCRLGTVYGNITVNISGGTIGYLFGGCQGAADYAADVKKFPEQIPSATENPGLHDYMTNHPGLEGTGGNITVNVYGGNIGSVFGGCDINGNVEGEIRVNVDENSSTEDCPLNLDYVYGASRLAQYAPVDSDASFPEVNLISGKVNIEVYGGGMGSETDVDAGKVTSNPKVTVNGESVVVGDANNLSSGNVFGGGELAQVDGSTLVLFQKGTAKGSVYGGGKGKARTANVAQEDDKYFGLVSGNTLVEMSDGMVERSVYGGGELGSVGTFTDFWGENEDPLHVAGEPKTCQEGTGLAKVLISGGQVGKNAALMPTTLNPDMDDFGYVFCGSRGEADSITYPMANLLGVVDTTYLEISGSALITASVYGGCENGQVLNGTYVKVIGGQIGTGYDATNNLHDGRYLETDWSAAITAVRNGTFTDALAAPFHECSAWPYGDVNGNHYVYDIFADPETYPGYDSHGGSIEGSNGHSFFGNVFGGGSGYYPINPGVWRRSAGRVCGDTKVEITGGHILTAVYGGNEITDVLGKSTVTMSGGTLGVPRTLDDIKAHPVTCSLFGAGMGDQRIMFNQWTNVGEVEVNVTGGTIFGSVFGGGEDGHVLGDVVLNISDDAHIGTWGYSHFDGNVFGGGRGFSGETLAAGTVGGDVEVNISDGTMLGSVYGGGRLASAGTYLVAADDPNYGMMQPDVEDNPQTEEDESETHGHVSIHITGGTIGNDYESKYHHKVHTRGGNVYGGSMGRLTLLNDATNPLWPQLAKVKNASITIEEENGNAIIIKGNVYGGGEFGTVTEDAEVAFASGTIWRNVYGGGFGSGDVVKKGVLTPNSTAQVTPMQQAGRVEGNTQVDVSGGWVKKSVYGGGEFASIGHITDSIKHPDETIEFALSWPYEFTYQEETGTATVNVTGGRIGITGKDYMGPWNENGAPVYYDVENDPDELSPIEYDLTDEDDQTKLKGAREDNGDVYGGARGSAGAPFLMAHAANSDNAVVTVEYAETNDARPENYRPNTTNWNKEWIYDFYAQASEWTTYGTRECIAGALYGGAENGHVNTNTEVTLENGLVGHSLYGGGKGDDTYEDELLIPNTNPPQTHIATITSITGGKVFGNTNVTVNGGYVVRNVFGGGNRASVGKGNYAGGPGDYQENGYGERWTEEGANQGMHAQLFNSGHTYVNINGGQIGTVDGEKDDLPTGNVFGGCRGTAAPNVRQTLSPRIHYYPEFFLGYVNHTHVTVGQNTGTDNGPRVYGSVYGGGQDGHVRWGTDVTVNKGEIGNEYTADNIATVGTDDMNSFQWLGRGNVYGAGSGLGKYKDENEEEKYSTSAGSVTQFTEVTVNGGIIHRNVYGGGSLAMVGPPRMTLQYDPESPDITLSKVTINSTIGKQSDVEQGYGGNVFGGSRGLLELHTESNFMDYSTSVFTEVNIGTLDDGSKVSIPGFVPGDVYGGGEIGPVRQNTLVNMNAGEVGTIGYDWEEGTSHNEPYNKVVHLTGGDVYGGGMGDKSVPDAARVKGNATVNVKGGHVYFNVYGGGEMASVGQRTIVREDPDDPDSEIVSITPVANTGLASVTIEGGQVGPAPREEEGAYNIPVALNGIDGYVYGGGKGIGEDPVSASYLYGQYFGIADVNNTNVTVDMDGWDPDQGKYNRIWGSIFGGAEDGHVLGNAQVNYVSGLTGTTGTTSWDGKIFGGGRNYSKLNYCAGRVQGNATVEMSGGQLLGSIFGGGRLALTGVDFKGDIIPDVPGDGTSSNEGETYGLVTVRVKGGTVGNEDLIADFTTHSMGDVFGGGKGDRTGIIGHPAASVLRISLTKNTIVEISEEDPDIPTRILGSVFGGGEMANVGHYFWDQDVNYSTTPPTITVSNIQLMEGTGNTNVTVKGGQIGYDNMFMSYEQDDDFKLVKNVDVGHVFGGGEGFVDDPNTTILVNNVPTLLYPEIDGKPLIEYMNTVGYTEVTICNTVDEESNEILSSPFVKGSVYGGAMSGHVEHDTWVKIQGGQIGFVEDPVTGVDQPVYSENQFFNPLTTPVSNANALAECPHWEYGKPDPATPSIIRYDPFDPVLVHQGRVPSDGKTWFGNVFGGGSGFYPYITKTGEGNQAVYESHWNQHSGLVKGTSRVDISGGHIITSVYGGCEVTDVLGSATVTMSGGTLGVPRTNDQVQGHPVTCYLFGGGKGDPRENFNTWTNVASTDVQISGGTIYGSVFGGGEEGHVLGDASVSISQPEDNTTIIGTTGYSYYDGNVFGGGRGFSGENILSGRVDGKADVDISGGTMLGNVYGGGRLASVVGDVSVHVTGGTIGNDHESIYTHPAHSTGGNVFGGSMGRLNKLDGTINSQWPLLAHVNKTTITIEQDNEGDEDNRTTIRGNVYGGGEFGTVLTDAEIYVTGGTIWRDVYGGGRGSDDTQEVTYIDPNTSQSVTTTALKRSGRVVGNTSIDISGGWVKKSVFGGGELASVGTPVSIVEHPAGGNNFPISWPVAYVYDDNTGLATVSVTGGRIGITGKDFMGPWVAQNNQLVPLVMIEGNYVPYDGSDAHKKALKDAREDNGDIYGGGKGLAGEPYKMDHLSNVNNTVVSIEYSNNTADPTTYRPYDIDFVSECFKNLEDWTTYGSLGCITGAVYGGGENGHVNNDTRVTFTKGLVGHAIYGGGKGKDKYLDSDSQEVYSLTAGKVYGNTNVTIDAASRTDAYVVRSVFGGGNTASVGKGNYNGFGESGTVDDSGTCTVSITGGTIGMLPMADATGVKDPEDVIKDNIPYGSVFGGCRGLVNANTDTPESIDSRLSYVNNTEVNIGTAGSSPLLYGSVYGGGQDGKVRYSTEVTVKNGEIGVAYDNPTAALGSVGTDDLNSDYWITRGNVFGAGSGISTYKDNNDVETYCKTSGSVFGTSTVKVEGGLIHQNVYGGGNLGSVFGLGTGTDHDKVKVIVSDNAQVGVQSDVNGSYRAGEEATSFNYGGNVYGAGKGFASGEYDASGNYKFKEFCNVTNTDVTVSGGHVYGEVYGGGENGHVTDNTNVLITGDASVGILEGDNGGTTTCDGNVFGGGKGSGDLVAIDPDDPDTKEFRIFKHCGRVGGNTNVTMDGGSIQGTIYGGGRLALVGVDEDGEITTLVTGSSYPDGTGKATVAVSGGYIGNSNGEKLLKGSDESVGDIFGSGKGDVKYYEDILAGRVAKTEINISGNPRIYGSVFGGGEMASVGYWYENAGKQVFYDNTGDAEVTLDDNPEVGTDMEYTASYADNPAPWTIYEDGKLIHTCTGNVFGAGQGDVDITAPHWVSMSRTKTSKVTVNGGTIKSGVFGGSEQGSVIGNTSVTINGGTIGTTVTPASGEAYNFGRVIGGGYGCDDVADLADTYTLDDDPNVYQVTNDSISLGGNLWRPNYLAGRVYGHSRVYFNDGTLLGDVFGGGDRGIVDHERVANINDGTVDGNVFGGGNTQTTNTAIGDVVHKSLKTVNVRGGHITGNVFGSSNNLVEGQEGATEREWMGFVNITGGQIDQNVFAAGAGGSVIGSLCLMVGKDAILNAPTYVIPTQPNSGNVNAYYNDSEGEPIEPAASKLVIGGSLFGGSQYYGNSQNAQWNEFVITGSSATFIDGTGYDTESSDETATNYMNIGGGIYGSGEFCESGASGRVVVVKDYGSRTMANDAVASVSRSLTTIQRGGIVLLDHSNIHFTGDADLSAQATGNYAMLKVDNSLFVANGSSLVLGTEAEPAHMDSIHELRSLYVKEGYTSYQLIGQGNNDKWYVLGLNDTGHDNNHLYRIDTDGIHGNALARSEENVILFNGTVENCSKLWVRYRNEEVGGQYYNLYGNLLGFFRMDSPLAPRGTESFAYARPKITEGQTDNTGDGGFLSYNNDYNFFTDNGDVFTNTEQHPYTNVYQLGKGDRVEYREWVILENNGRKWYVDGSRNWGRDDMSKTNGWGLYPDKPKKTLFGAVTYDPVDNPNGDRGGVITESLTNYEYDFEKDVIYIVGALSATDEGALLHSDQLVDQAYALKLYRYPGGHRLSNNISSSTWLDYGTGTDPEEPNTNTGLLPIGTENHDGPGPNYGALLRVQNGADLTLLNDEFDGLYGFETNDITLHQIPTSLPTGAENFTPTKVNEPLVIAEAGSTLTLKGGTTLMRGCNNTNADVWYTDSDYAPTGNVHHGGALFVDGSVDGEGNDVGATVNVEGLVTITGNKQYLKIGDGTARFVNSNVYLPTFNKSLTISGDENLDVDTRIGVTSPRRNDESNYMSNTFSPVAVAGTPAIAQNAWQQRNFHDDQGWFFVNGHTGTSPRTTYYDPTNVIKTESNTLYFGWTWANVVRSMPEDFDYENVDSAEDLAWIISKVNGMNEQTASTLANYDIKQTADIDLLKYVWLPIGYEGHLFKGSYDGQGHTLSNLEISFIGKGDRIYERNNYGLFGNVSDGTIDRAFVVSGKISPVGSANIGGLVGKLEGADAMVSNSEAAVRVVYPVSDDNNKYYSVGGLVGEMVGGGIHSSMAMPDIFLYAYRVAGGLVGVTQATADAEPTIPSIKNSFANAEITVGDITDHGAGGLVGLSQQLQMENCYSHNKVLEQPNYATLVAQVGNATVRRCYGDKGSSFSNTVGAVFTDCYRYTPVIGSDNLGYMYADNRIEGSAADTTLFAQLNMNAYAMNRVVHDSTYAHWMRPGLSEINSDLPLLLLGEFDGMEDYQGTFRSVGTYAGGSALQYGGPLRDGDDDEVNAALTREKASTNADCLFIYGDVTEKISVSDDITQGKVSVSEHASILHPGDLGVSSSKSDYANTYVGITFDNSCGQAYSTPGVNYSLVGIGGQLLPRDWHMFSTPLSNAPQGFDYQGQNTDTYSSVGGDYSNANYFNNPWVSMSNEFTWLNDGHSGNNRYWMSGDGYFPTSRGTLFEDRLDEIFILNSDEHPSANVYRYPYGMDLYAWYEPDYHWVNFKRNGPNHWHSDENSQGSHDHLDYYGSVDGEKNVNEETLIPAKGYMATIATPTFMQSHGTLNAGGQSIVLTEEGKHLKGWNLVGNPYHGYIDFNELAKNEHNQLVLSKDQNNNPFYVVYDADEYIEGYHGSGFLYQPSDGSKNGAYAGRFIHPHQGFYVQLVEGASAVTDPYLEFDESMVVPRSDVTESHFRDWQPNYPLVNLYLSSDHGCADITVIELERPEWGGAAKLKDLRVGNGIFYGHHDDNNYAAMYVKKGTERVPLRFEAKEDDIFTIKWETANGDFHSMYLVDNITGANYDMIRNSSYTFEGHKGDYWSRFYIVFDVTGVEENGLQPFVFFDGSEYVVTGDGDLEFIDLQGRVLWRTSVSGQSRVGPPKVAAGMYLFRLIESKNVKVQKVIVQ